MPVRCDRRTFERLVAAAIEEIPERFRERLRNVAIVVEEMPTLEQVRACGLDPDEGVYALYEGVALNDRAVDGEPVFPDRITIFRAPLLEDCESLAALQSEIVATIRHEIAHHFGIDDDRLEELGKY